MGVSLPQHQLCSHSWGWQIWLWGLLFSPRGFLSLPVVLEAPVVLHAGGRAGHVTPKMGTWSWWLHPGNLQPWGKNKLGMRRERAEGSGCTLGCRAGLWCVLGVQCWPMGCSQGTRGQQGPAAATTAGCSGSSGASPWEPAVRGNPRSCWGGALLHPARGEHPTPRSVLLLLKLPLRLVDTGGAQSQLSCTSPGLDPKVAPHVPGQSRAAPQQCPWCRGLTGEGPPCQVTVCHCSDGWGGGRHGMCGGVVAGGRPPCRRVPLFLTPVSVRMVHAALCNADADEGKVPFSARLWLPPPPVPPSSRFRVPVCHH